MVSHAKVVIFLQKQIYMKRIITILALAASTIGMQAQSLEQFFCSTPDSVQPYIKKLDREALVLSVDRTKDTLATMTIAMGGDMTLTHLSPSLIVFHPSKVLTMEYAQLPAEGDSVYCVISTYKAPEAESNVKIYSKDWKLLSSLDISDKAKLARPDTISEARFDEIIKSQDFKMTMASIDKKDSQTLNVQFSMPMMDSEEKKAFLPVNLQTTLKWDGKTFN